MPVIELKKLTKFFGAVPAVLEASLTVEEGDFFGFVGPNGSGKSTTIRMMMNYVRPTSGTATILGMDSRSQSGNALFSVGGTGAGPLCRQAVPQIQDGGGCCML